MGSHTRSPTGDAAAAFVSWLVTGGVGPALVALPVNVAADKLADAAVHWFKRFRQTDDLSRLVKAATGTSTVLSRAEIKDLRRLLEDEETWRQLAGNDVTRLTGRVAGCLPQRDNRTAEDARAAAEAIARGLLEFAVFDLQLEVFRKVVLARLHQMTCQTSALDEALLRMHKDLYAFVDDGKDLFRQVMDQLPVGPADLNEIKIYLKTLVNWLNTDPWPRDPRLGGPVLTPAAIEQKLRVSTIGTAREQDIDADELTRRCSRLVILGSSGSGKTWLAMRTARICAEEALNRLDGEATLDEVELPLYTTCSRLIGTSVGFREAAVSTALNWMGDLGGSRIIKALRLFFTERDKPTLLVIDSLDEASDAGLARDRLRQADSLGRPWRVVLTSRRSSWNNQINIDEGNRDHRVGELQPMRYPEDIETVVGQWFAGNPERGQALAAQLAGRSDLRQAATVPLILAFFCILGGDRPLPKFRHELYRQVINRMLHGPWRQGSGPPPDLGVCRAALRGWAWQGAKPHPVSGVGQWMDDIATERAQLSADGHVAIDHIATPQGGPNFDTGETSRRFVHRSIQEHLVAEHVAQMPAEETAAELLSHLWYDPDWEYAAPAALTMHAQREQVLKELINRVTGGDQLIADLAAIDGCWEIRRFLARVARESREVDWPLWAAGMIGQAMLDLATSQEPYKLRQVIASDWPTSNGPIIESLLASEAVLRRALLLAELLVHLDADPEEKEQAREALLTRLASETNLRKAGELAEALAKLDPTAQEKARARETLLTLLATDIKPYAAGNLVNPLAGLDPAVQEKARAREVLLTRLATVADPGRTRELAQALAPLDLPAQEKKQAGAKLLALLASETNPMLARDLVEALAALDPTVQEKEQAREALLTLLASVAGPGMAQVLSGALAGLTRELAEALAKLDPTVQEKARAREVLLALLASEIKPWMARKLVEALAKLDPTVEEKARARETLLVLLVGETNPGLARDLAEVLVGLDLTVQEKARAREVVLTLLANGTNPKMAWEQAEEWAREVLFTRFASATGMARDLIQALAGLEPPRQDKKRGGGAVLLRLSAEVHEHLVVPDLARTLAKLDPTVQEKARARKVLLTLLASETKPYAAKRVVEALAALDLSAQEKEQAREVLLTGLASVSGRSMDLAQALANLDPTVQEKARAREVLLTRLTTGIKPYAAERLVEALAALDPTVQEKARARKVLLTLLASETNASVAANLGRALVPLTPTIADFGSSDSWPVPPTSELLAVVRKNSALSDWLKALPLFSRPAHTVVASAAGAPAAPNNG